MKIRIEEHRNFRKYFAKLSPKQKTLFVQRIRIFAMNPNHSLLKTHSLEGWLKNFSAFTLGGDLRVVFQWITKDHILLHKVGTHNQVY